ncbi:MAG: hypothetical protein ACF8CQ_10395, partial [Rhodopirellula sp. JB044]|uniref:hypothetical protein n=1 Tax=Rhodopirellula sp. JB044 TaxID=3342844 RepID=UPI00370AB4C1
KIRIREGGFCGRPCGWPAVGTLGRSANGMWGLGYELIAPLECRPDPRWRVCRGPSVHVGNLAMLSAIWSAGR